MSYVFQVVNKPRTYWDGKVGYVRPERKRWRTSYGYRAYKTTQRKVLEEIKDEWSPSFSTNMHVESDLRKAKRLMTHYNVQRMRSNNAKRFPELVLRRIEYKPLIKEAIRTTTVAQLSEAARLKEAFGQTLADSYGRLPLFDDEIIFEIAVKRKGKSIDAIRNLDRGESHGMYTFFRSKAEYVHARLALGQMIDRIYYLQEGREELNTGGKAAL